jgi:hypothetical protein
MTMAPKPDISVVIERVKQREKQLVKDEKKLKNLLEKTETLSVATKRLDLKIKKHLSFLQEVTLFFKKRFHKEKPRQQVNDRIMPKKHSRGCL